MEPMGAKWMTDLYNYLVARPQIIKNGFKHVGIIDFLEQ